MIKSLADSFSILLRKPWIVLPALVGGLISLALFSVAYESFAELVIQLLVLDNTLQGNIIELPVRIFQTFPAQTITLTGLLLVNAFISFIVFYFYARFAREYQTIKNISMTTTVKFTLSKLKDIFYLLLFFTLMGVLAWTALWLITAISFNIAAVELALTLVLLILLVYAVFKFLFAVPALTDGKTNLKNALQKSWQFTRSRFITLILLLIVLTVINVGAAYAINAPMDALDNDMAYVSAILIATAVFTAFNNLGISRYYFNQKPEMETAPGSETIKSVPVKKGPKENEKEFMEEEMDEEEMDAEEEGTEADEEFSEEEEIEEEKTTHKSRGKKR